MKSFVALPALLFALGLAAPDGLGAVEVQQGRTRLVLHEGIGRFSLYYRTDAAKGQAGGATVPLFVDRDPRTSGLSLLVGNRIYRLGEAGDFQERAERTSEGARFTWQSKQLAVSQEFRLTPTRPDVVVMEISVTNLTASTLDVGLRLCLDTYLGEGELSHFRTDREPEIPRELTVRPSDGVRYWVSASKEGPAGSAGLFSLISGPEVTVPDKVVFANWKRLNQASWTYETSQTRNFNLVPYSINDSAVCQYYDPAPVPARATRSVTIALGSLSALPVAGGPVAAPAVPEAPAAPAVPEAPAAAPPVPEAPAATPPVPEAPAAATASTAALQSLQEELRLLDSLLQTLQEHLASGSPVSDEDIRLIRETLSGIKSRSAEY